MSNRLNVLESALEEIFPWYVGDGGQSEYSINKYVSDRGTAVAIVFKGEYTRYILQVFSSGGVEFTSYFPSVDFRCDGKPFITHEARRNVRVKDSYPESMDEVKRMADDEHLYNSVRQEVAEWVDSVYSEISKGMPVEAAVQVVNCDLGELS